MGADELVALARASAAAHRLGMTASGGALLARFAEGLGEYARVEPGRVMALGGLLAAITAAQERGDGIAVADALEHEVVSGLVGPSAASR